MGCKSSRPDTFNIETEFRAKNLIMPEATKFESEFEREAFMTINLFRYDPRSLIPQIKSIKSKYKRNPPHSTVDISIQRCGLYTDNWIFISL